MCLLKLSDENVVWLMVVRGNAAVPGSTVSRVNCILSLALLLLLLPVLPALFQLERAGSHSRQQKGGRQRGCTGTECPNRLAEREPKCTRSRSFAFFSSQTVRQSDSLTLTGALVGDTTKHQCVPKI